MPNKCKTESVSVPENMAVWLDCQQQLKPGTPRAHYYQQGLKILMDLDKIKPYKDGILALAFVGAGLILILFGYFLINLYGFEVLAFSITLLVIGFILFAVGDFTFIKLAYKLKKRRPKTCT